jgi:hypothetical protein
MATHELREQLALFAVLASFAVIPHAHASEPVPAPGISERRISADRDLKQASAASWALQLAVGPRTFGGRGLVPGQPTSTAVGFTFEAEYLLPLLRRYGAIGIGPTAGLYPLNDYQDTGNGRFPAWTLGGLATYQARFGEAQVVVPTVGYELEDLHYAYGELPAGNVLVQGPRVGLELFLNALDFQRAADFHELTGISRTYIVLEGRALRGGDDFVRVSGMSWYAGLRFEM